jgi:hypothetical protein
VDACDVCASDRVCFDQMPATYVYKATSTASAHTDASTAAKTTTTTTTTTTAQTTVTPASAAGGDEEHVALPPNAGAWCAIACMRERVASLMHTRVLSAADLVLSLPTRSQTPLPTTNACAYTSCRTVNCTQGMSYVPVGQWWVQLRCARCPAVMCATAVLCVLSVMRHTRAPTCTASTSLSLVHCPVCA